MSQQKPILVLRNKKNKCYICNSKHKKFIDELLYKGLPEKQVLVQLEIQEIKDISLGHLMSHSRFHIDNDKMKEARAIWLHNLEAMKLANVPLETLSKRVKDHKTKENEINSTIQAVQAASNLPDKIKEVPMNEKEKKDMAIVQNKIRKKRKDLNLLDEMVNVMEINKARLKQSRDNEIDNEVVLGITSKIADSHFKNAVKMHEITSGMNSLKDVRLAEITVMLTNVMFRHEVSDITRFDMFRVFKMFQHVGLEAETLAQDNKEAIKFEHAHSFAEIQTKMDYNKAFAAETLKKNKKPDTEKVNVNTQKVNVNPQKDNVNVKKVKPTIALKHNNDASSLLRQFRKPKKKK